MQTTVFSMNLFKIHFYKRLRYCFYNSFNGSIRQYNHNSNNEEHNMSSNQQKSVIKSTKYPDYNVIYSFPYITHAFILNKFKRNCTVFIGASIPITVTLQMLDFISEVETMSAIYINCLIALILHTLGYMCNYSVGSICFKEDDQKVIISYINYWGKRIDLKVSLNDIIPVTEVSSNFSKVLYKDLHIKSCKQKLKLYAKHGKIIEKSNFYNIFGDDK